MSLDHFIEGSDVRRFFDSASSLVVIGFCLGMRRINLIVRVVFVEGDVDLGSLEFVMGPLVRAPLTLGSLFGCVYS